MIQDKSEVTIGVVLLCRYSSTRLPGKIFREIKGKPIIEYIVERILSSVDRSHFIIATSKEKSDDKIEEYCLHNNLNCYRGSLEDVAGRFLEAGTLMGWDYAVRINGDNLFVATDVLKVLMREAKLNKFDFITNTHGKTFPQGMSVEIVRMGFFRNAYKLFKTNDDFEHVTFYLHRNKIGEYLFWDNTEYPEAGQLKFAIDEQKDFDLCSRIFDRFTRPQVEYMMPQILDIYKKIINE